jgi:hypothetical protein
MASDESADLVSRYHFLWVELDGLRRYVDEYNELDDEFREISAELKSRNIDPDTFIPEEESESVS